MKVVLPLVTALAASLASAGASLLLDEPFDYADGPLATVSGGLWTEFSGTGGENVLNHSLSLDDDFSGDDSRALSGAVTSGTIYASFSLTVPSTDLPTSTSTSNYFFALQPSNYYGRIVVYRPQGSTDGMFTLALGADSSVTGANYTDWETELAADTTHTVVMSFELSTRTATLWVDPVGMDSTSITSLGTGSVASIDSVAFRLSGNAAGDKTIDNLLVGTEFTDVAPVPEPGTVAMVGLGITAILFGERVRRRF